MPQFDVSTFPSQIFWLVLCVLTLYVVTSRIMLPRLQEIYRERWQNTEGLRMEAEELQKQGQDIQCQVDLDFHSRRQNANNMILNTIKDLGIEQSQRRQGLSHRHRSHFKDLEIEMRKNQETTLSQSLHLTQSLKELIVSKVSQDDFTLYQEDKDRV
jgi:F-type H+-transporting ATPase subunit b